MDNATIRKVYAYYKQATVGDISGRGPVHSDSGTA